MAGESMGVGSSLQFKANGSYTTLARVLSVGEVSLGDVDDIPFVAWDTSEGFREHLPGIKDAGEFEINGIWTAHASQISLENITGIVKDWRIVLAGGLGQLDFEGYLSGPRINPQTEDKIEFSATVRITGKVDYV